MKKYPATDFNGLWSYLKSVTTDGPYAVKITLKQPSSMFFYYISQTPIVPAAILRLSGAPVQPCWSVPERDEHFVGESAQISAQYAGRAAGHQHDD